MHRHLGKQKSQPRFSVGLRNEGIKNRHSDLWGSWRRAESLSDSAAVAPGLYSKSNGAYHPRSEWNGKVSLLRGNQGKLVLSKHRGTSVAHCHSPILNQIGVSKASRHPSVPENPTTNIS